MSILKSELNTILYVNNDPYSYIAAADGFTGALNVVSTDGTLYNDTYINVDTLNNRLNLGSSTVNTFIDGVLTVDGLDSTLNSVDIFPSTENIYIGSTGSVYIASGENSNIFFGSTGSNIHFNGFLASVSTDNLTVSDPVITLNKGQLDSVGSGIEIDENGVISASMKIFTDKKGYIFVTPEGVNDTILKDDRLEWYDSGTDTSLVSISKSVDNNNVIISTSSGADVYITPASLQSTVVLTEGNQTINGNKIFSGPVVSSSTGYFAGVVSSASGSFQGLNVAGNISADVINCNDLNLSGDISFSNLTLPGYLTVSGTGTFNGPLISNGTGTFNGRTIFNKSGLGIEVTDSMSVGGYITVSQTGYFTGVNVSQSGSFGGIYCSSSGTFNGTLFANCNTGTSLVVSSVSNSLSLNDGSLVVIGGTAVGKDLRVGGTAYKPTSQFWTISSDKRIKTDISPLSDYETINSLKSINIKKYKLTQPYREKYKLDDKQYIGVIADEFMTTHPESINIVTENLGGDNITDFKTVDMSFQLFELISCCQNLLKRVEVLEAKCGV